MSEGLQLKVNLSPWSNSVEIAFFDKVGGKVCVGEPVKMRPLSKGEAVAPAAALTWNNAQDLFNELWRIGFRPIDGTGNSGHIQALSYHLEDMRALVFKGKKP